MGSSDHIKVKLSGASQPTSGNNVNPVPEENLPGHRPEKEQDKPDLSGFVLFAGQIASGEDHIESGFVLNELGNHERQLPRT